MPADLVIRPWQPADHDAVIPMLLDCIAANHEAGSDLVPTLANAERLWGIGMAATQAGDPTLMATVGDTRIGWTLWAGLPGDFDRTVRVCHGFGTYVAPAFRRTGVASALRRAAGACARARGYGKVIGTAFHEAGQRSVEAVGFVATGRQMEWWL